MSLLKENTYSKVLINATNQSHLAKNENEYLGNLFDVDQQSMMSTNADNSAPIPDKPREKKLATINAACLRKINILTAKERPFCSYCNVLVGYRWFIERKSELKKKKDPEDDQEMQEDKAEQEDKLQVVGESNEDNELDDDEPQDIILCKTCHEERNYPEDELDQALD